MKGSLSMEAVADMHSEGNVLYFTANSTLVGAKLNVCPGQTELIGNYQTQAKLTVAGFDIGKPLAMFGPGTVKAQSLY